MFIFGKNTKATVTPEGSVNMVKIKTIKDVGGFFIFHLSQ